MAKLGSKARPLVLRVQSQDDGYFAAATCAEHGWEYVMAIDPGQPEDLSDLDAMIHPAAPAQSAKLARNGPCPCGSGKKYKKCCGSSSDATRPGQPKLSAVIWDYAEPLTKTVTSTKETTGAANLAILCWNAALLPAAEQSAFIEESLRKIGVGDPAIERDLSALLQMMVARKHTYFPDDDRVIVDYSITETENGLHLLVKSTRVAPDALLPGQPVSVPGLPSQ